MCKLIIGTIPASISPLQVQPFGTRATVTLTSSAPTALAFAYRPVASPLDTGGVLTTGDSPPPAAYQTQHQFELKPLQSNTAYELSIVATTRTGQQLTARTGFTTLKKRVRIALDKIAIEQDGDWGGKGEPIWLWGVFLGRRGGRAVLSEQRGAGAPGFDLPRRELRRG